MAGTSAALSQPHLSVVDGHFTGSPWPPLKADAKATTRLPEQTRGFRRMTKPNPTTIISAFYFSCIKTRRYKNKYRVEQVLSPNTASEMMVLLESGLSTRHRV